MRKLTLVAAAAAAIVAVPAFAQDMSAGTTAPAGATDTTAAPMADTTAAPVQTSSTDNGTGPRSPDGSRAFGIEPYVAVLGGWEQFDNEPTKAGIPQSVSRNDKLAGGLVEGIVGFNVPLGPVFVGAEANLTKGFTGDINWEYGGAGRVGFRAGDSGLIYGKVGYQWVRFDGIGTRHDYHDMTYGVGFEVGPKSIGLGGVTGNAGVRLRGEVSTFGDAHSFRPMLGLVTHF